MARRSKDARREGRQVLLELPARLPPPARLAAAALLLLAGALGSCDRAKPPQYRSEPVARGDIRVQVSATGTLNPVTSVQVGSQVSGTIAALYADFNSRVKEGAVLAQLDPTFLRAQVAQNEADLERARVGQRQAERDLARLAPLRDEGLTSQAELDAAESALDEARASVKSAEAALERAQTNLRYATIRSPIDGVVVSRDVDVGQTVAASLSAPTLFTIANDLAQMQLEAWVDEADIGRVVVDQPVSFTVDAFPERSFEGRVQQIRLSPRTEQNVVSYTVIAAVPNPELRLLPGMTANVTFLVDEVRGVLKVPAAALRFRSPPRGPAATDASPAGGPPGARSAPRIHILRPDGSLATLAVAAGLSDGVFTAITADSLREGMLAVVGEVGASATSEGTVNPFAPGGMRRDRR